MNHAQIAIIAAKHYRAWGRHMSKAYAIKRGVSLNVWRLACQLEAAKRGNV